ncbi:DUF2637 domain-containing protein [Streptomyces sp. NPDC000618]|uniref:DUF2637 domain-containing protein n=1 Tax=Streptomyces sp. NPDC000618 TaxID=3154265 RepID=UPI00331CDF78
MKTLDASRALAIAAGLVIVALTAAAFWLSYAHLAEVALAHGMRGKEVRAWAWPATLDLFIVAGELLMLRAALAGRVDGWAIGLTVVGSGSSIALNVAGVGSSAEVLDYVVAAVPPTAALLAFGALMRQVHQALTGRAEGARADTSRPVVEVEVHRPEVPPVTPLEVTGAEASTELPALPAKTATPLVICGDRRVWHPAFPSRDEDDEVSGTAGDRLLADAAATVIRAAWVTGTPVAETARQATRSTSYVKKVFARLAEEQAEDRAPSIALVPAVRS